MTAEAYIKQGDPFRRGIEIAVLDRVPGGVHILKWQQTREFVRDEESAARSEPDSSVFFHLSDDEGRALYEALAKHYGHTPDSPTLLREDYLAERKRVDKFIDKAVKEG